jgi:hypothetical protein
MMRKGTQKYSLNECFVDSCPLPLRMFNSFCGKGMVGWVF